MFMRRLEKTSNPTRFINNSTTFDHAWHFIPKFARFLLEMRLNEETSSVLDKRASISGERGAILYFDVSNNIFILLQSHTHIFIEDITWR